MTAEEATRRVDGLTERHLYAWVDAGLITAYQSRYTKYTLYSLAEIREHLTREQALRYLGPLERDPYPAADQMAMVGG